MKKALSILKVTGIIVLLIGATIGYLFFYAWQKNERPEAYEVTWQKDNIVLGHQGTLDFTIRAPWHREIRSAHPSNYPTFLPPVPDLATLKRGALALNGYRTWTASVPLVATDIKSVEGLSLSLPLKPTKRPSPSSVNVPLPKLTIHMPGNLPKLAANPTNFILEDAIPKVALPPSIEDTSTFPWIPIIAAIIAIGSMIFIYLRNQSGSMRPPAWETALARLSDLEKETALAPDLFFSQLTDILKNYTSDRFLITASAKTSSEFLSSVYSLPDLPQVETMELPWLARLADDIKFAGRDPESKDPPEALDLVRRFVLETKPVPDPDTDA